MKRTVFIAGCAIALAGSASALTMSTDAGVPAVVAYENTAWIQPAIDATHLAPAAGQAADDAFAPLILEARRGADDGPGHDSGHHSCHRGGRDGDDDSGRRGDDDGPGHHRGGHGADDGPGHHRDHHRNRSTDDPILMPGSDDGTPDQGPGDA
jgi:hypothetical protein